MAGKASTHGGGFSVEVGGPGLALYVAVSVLYFILMEHLAGGSIGKLLAGVRVRSEEGGRAAAWQIVVRNLLRPFDVLPALYLLGFLVLMASGPERRQRIGDRLARTVVVPREATSPPPPPA